MSVDVPNSIAAIRVPVHVVLGRVTRSLGDIFKLDAGAVVDLDRSAAEPVEVVVNGRVIAWGELVVASGNYGVKITAKAEKRELA
jgi:flagellar motor switch protein FliN/FliY